MSNDYVPIACAFYDELEAAAVKRLENTIVYLNEEAKETQITARIVDFKTLNKEEFMVLQSGVQIRLDKIVLFNGKKQMSENCQIY